VRPQQKRRPVRQPDDYMLPLAILLVALGALVLRYRWPRLLALGGLRAALTTALLAVLVAGVVAFMATGSGLDIPKPILVVLAPPVYVTLLLYWTGSGWDRHEEQRALLARLKLAPAPKGETPAERMERFRTRLRDEMELLRSTVPTDRRAAKRFAGLVTGQLQSLNELKDPRTREFRDALGKPASEWQEEARHLEAELRWCNRYLGKS
jgi:hypothetical protein